MSMDKVLAKKHFESYEEISKQKQSIMVTLFGQKVYCAKSETFESTNEKVNRNFLKPLMNDSSQDTENLRFPLRTEASDTNLFGKRSEKETISSGLGLLDLNKTPSNEPVFNHQWFFQDLNVPYTEETKMISKKSGLDEKDNATSPASCCTVENNSRTELEDSCEVIQTAAECLVLISAVNVKQTQDQDFLSKEEPSRSCDSYELHTLGIKETILEDVSCVSSKVIDEFSNSKEVGVKLRRGRRRMKNFQKEILPGLVSLSRHEIHEDLNILGAVLRSKEYKKMHGKTRDGKCRPNTEKNRCSTQRYVGRRSRRRTE